MSQYRNVFFEPWVGSEYFDKGLWNKRVLIVGESHYDRYHSDKSNNATDLEKPKQNLERNYTKECIQEVIDGEGGATFWSVIRNRVGGMEHQDTIPSVFWNKVAFYNFVQTPVDGTSRVSPTKQQFIDSVDAFSEVLKIINPERIIVTGDRMHPYIPPRNAELPGLTSKDGNLHIPVQYFADGDKFHFITMTSHPTSSYFQRGLSELFNEFIVTDWINKRRHPWSNELIDRTLRFLKEDYKTATIDKKINLKHGNFGYAYLFSDDLDAGIARLIDRSTKIEYSYASIDKIIDDGWVLD